MCFHSSEPPKVKQKQRYQFRIFLADLQQESFVVEAMIRWVQDAGSCGVIAGAIFCKSSKGWLSSRPHSLSFS
jgi:hypothetical protein